jgi:hypothetical protein
MKTCASALRRTQNTRLSPQASQALPTGLDVIELPPAPRGILRRTHRNLKQRSAGRRFRPIRADVAQPPARPPAPDS